MNENRIKISATSIEEFKKIEDKLKELSPAVLNQIKCAEYNKLLDCIKCELIPSYCAENTIYLPGNKTFKSMKTYEDETVIVFNNSEFIFRIKNTQCRYEFVVES